MDKRYILQLIYHPSVLHKYKVQYKRVPCIFSSNIITFEPILFMCVKWLNNTGSNIISHICNTM